MLLVSFGGLERRRAIAEVRGGRRDGCRNAVRPGESTHDWTGVMRSTQYTEAVRTAGLFAQLAREQGGSGQYVARQVIKAGRHRALTHGVPAVSSTLATFMREELGARSLDGPPAVVGGDRVAPQAAQLAAALTRSQGLPALTCGSVGFGGLEVRPACGRGVRSGVRPDGGR